MKTRKMNNDTKDKSRFYTVPNKIDALANHGGPNNAVLDGAIVEINEKLRAELHTTNNRLESMCEAEKARSRDLIKLAEGLVASEAQSEAFRIQLNEALEKLEATEFSLQMADEQVNTLRAQLRAAQTEAEQAKGERNQMAELLDWPRMHQHTCLRSNPIREPDWQCSCELRAILASQKQDAQKINPPNC